MAATILMRFFGIVQVVALKTRISVHFAKTAANTNNPVNT